MFLMLFTACVVNTQDPNLKLDSEAKSIKEFLEKKREEEKQAVNYAYPFIRDQQPSAIKLKSAP